MAATTVPHFKIMAYSFVYGMGMVSLELYISISLLYADELHLIFH